MSTDESNSTSPSENAVGLPCPPFDIANPRVWFTQMEAVFRCRHITRQDSMFSHVVANLPTHVATEVIDIIDPMPAESPYDKLKFAILKRTTVSEEARLQQLLSGVQLGDRTPSQLLRHMRSLVGTANLDDSILRQLWIKCLPANTTAILAASSEKVSLEILADTADKIHEVFLNRSLQHIAENTPSTSTTDPNLSAISERLSRLELTLANLTRSRSSSRRSSTQRFHRSRSRPKYCFYHRRFGDRARNCRPGCQHPKAFTQHQSGNSGASQ